MRATGVVLTSNVGLLAIILIGEYVSWYARAPRNSSLVLRVQSTCVFVIVSVAITVSTVCLTDWTQHGPLDVVF